MIIKFIEFLNEVKLSSVTTYKGAIAPKKYTFQEDVPFLSEIFMERYDEDYRMNEGLEMYIELLLDLEN